MATDMGGFAQSGGPVLVDQFGRPLGSIAQPIVGVSRMDFATALGGETSIILGGTPIPGSVAVFVNGSLVSQTSISGVFVALTSALSAGNVVGVIYRTFNPSPSPSTLSSFSTTAASIYSKLAAWWELSETSGTTFADSHTGGYNLTISGATLGATTIRTGGTHAATFGSNKYATATTGPNLYGAGAASVTAWIRPATKPVNASYNPPIVGNRDNTTTDKAYWLGVPQGHNYMEALWTNSSVNVTCDDSSATEFAASSTHFIGYSAIYGVTKTIQFFIDGAVSSGPTGFSTVQSGGTDTRVLIGAISIYPAQYYFNGDIQQACVWRDALTPTEIAYLYNGGAGYSYAQLKSNAGH